MPMPPTSRKRRIARAADAVRAVKGGYSGQYAGAAGAHQCAASTATTIRSARPAFETKVKLLETIDAYARAQGPARAAGLGLASGATWQVVEILRADGETYRDVRPLVRLNVSVVAGDGDRQETGSHGYGGREGYRALHRDRMPGSDAVDDAVRQALVNLEAVPAPAGEMDVVLGPGWPGVMLHEAVGHGLEGDFNRKKTSAFAGLMGQQVAAKGVTVVDDGTIAQRRGSLSIDDEGTPTNRTVLIEDGILVGYMQDRQNARLMGMKPTGNGRRESYAHVPMPRMTNTYMLAGERDPGEIIASVKNGIYAVNFGGGQVDITSGKYVFQCTEAYQIENGKLGAPLKGAMLIGNGPTDLHRIGMIGNDLVARSRHRHLRQERPGRAGRRRPADPAHGPHHGRRDGVSGGGREVDVRMSEREIVTLELDTDAVRAAKTAGLDLSAVPLEALYRKISDAPRGETG